MLVKQNVYGRTRAATYSGRVLRDGRLPACVHDGRASERAKGEHVLLEQASERRLEGGPVSSWTLLSLSLYQTAGAWTDVMVKRNTASLLT